VIGFIVDVLCFVPTLLFVQLFRRIRPRRKPNQLSPVVQALIQLRGTAHVNASKRAASPAAAKRKRPLLLPWWWLIIAYIISFLVVIMAAFVTVARSIEFGDTKTQKWLVSILASFLSSVFLSHPIKVICLTVFIACLKRTSLHDDDEMALRLYDNEELYLNDDEDYLHEISNPMTAIRKSTPSNRLAEGQVAHARSIRLRDKHMWQAVREMLGFIFLAFTIYTLSYLGRDPNASFQVTHLRNLFLNVGRANNDFTQVCPCSFFFDHSPLSS
jgi:polycystin 1L2